MTRLSKVAVLCGAGVLTACGHATIDTGLARSNQVIEKHLDLRGGLTLDLPLEWQLRDSSSVRFLVDTTRRLIKTMKMDTTRLSARSVTASTLLIADGPGQAEAILGVAPAPGIASPYFGRLSPLQLEAYRNRFCELIGKATRAQKRAALTCGPLVRDSVSQREAILIRYDLAEAEGDEHGLTIQVATSDAIVTLNFISRRGSLEVDLPVFRRIWKSLVVPDTLTGLTN